MRGKREWYIAVSDASGEHAGGPPTPFASTIYGPYTQKQAEAVYGLSDHFPDETYQVTIFRADERPPFRSLAKKIMAMVVTEIAETEAYDPVAEHDERVRKKEKARVHHA